MPDHDDPTMPDQNELHDELHDGLRRMAQRLEDDSRPTDAATAMARDPQRGRGAPRPIGRTVVAALAAIAVVAGGIAAVRAVRDDPPAEVITDQPPEPPPATDPPSAITYEGTPVSDLPREGVAIVDDDTITLLGFDGTELAVATTPVAWQIGSGPAPGPPTIAVRPGDPILLEPGGPDPAEAPPGCDGAAGGGGVRVALCKGEEQLRATIVRVDPSGGVELLQDEAPRSRVETGGESRVAGHWRWALPSPDGRWVLAQWSGECEIPTALLLPTGAGDLRTVDGEPDITPAVESTALGWAPDGRAVVHLGGGACGIGADEPGVHLVDPDSGAATLVRPTPVLATRAYLWRQERYPNTPERIFERALAELGAEGCCGEPSHGGPSATVGIQWEGVDVPVHGSPVVEPAHVLHNDLVLSSEPIEIDGLPATAGDADLGPFVSFTCGGYVWDLGGAGNGGRSTDSALRALASALIPRLYCTVGERPLATGHGTP